MGLEFLSLSTTPSIPLCPQDDLWVAGDEKILGSKQMGVVSLEFLQ